jgi:hypothetical protein
LLKRLAAVAAMMVIPFAPIAPVYAAPDTEETSDDEEPTEPEEAEPAPEGDVGTFGYAVGVDPRTWQFSNSFLIRHSPWGNWSEAAIGIISRSQVLEPVNQAYAIESAGLNAQVGVKAWFVRLGLSAELDWVKKVVQAGNGRLSFQNSPGFLLEPYIGSTLPFLQTPFTSLDARVYVPITTFAPGLTFLRPDPAYGPRLQLTLWVGLPGGDDEEEGEEEPDEEAPSDDEGEPSMDDEDEDEEEKEEAPAPTPTPKPTPKK